MSLINESADLYLHTTKIKKWDICAPNAILNNLGGKLTDRRGNLVNYENKEHVSVDGLIATLTMNNYDYFFNIFKKD